MIISMQVAVSRGDCKEYIGNKSRIVHHIIVVSGSNESLW